MKLLDRIRESRQKSVLPAEVKQYYQTETRQRRGMAIGLALVALLATIAVAAALFFGGRFVYNKIQGDDKDQKKDTSQNQGADSNNGEETRGQVNTPDNSQGQQTGPSQKPTPAPTTPAPGTAPNNPPAQPNPTTPALGDTPLPRTGDEGM